MTMWPIFYFSLCMLVITMIHACMGKCRWATNAHWMHLGLDWIGLFIECTLDWIGLDCSLNALWIGLDWIAHWMHLGLDWIAHWMHLGLDWIAHWMHLGLDWIAHWIGLDWIAHWMHLLAYTDALFLSGLGGRVLCKQLCFNVHSSRSQAVQPAPRWDLRVRTRRQGLESSSPNKYVHNVFTTCPPLASLIFFSCDF